MFQDFDAKADPSHGPTRVRALRAQFKRRKIDGYLVPRTDEHRSEYVPPSAERLKWLTGFSGSAGIAVVLAHKAAMFVDGRYTVQVRHEVDPATFEIHKIPDARLTGFLIDNAKRDARIGYDPKLHTISEIKLADEALAGKDIALVPIEDNLVDAIWPDRPEPPLAPVFPHSREHAGQSAVEKIGNLQKTLQDRREDAVVLTLTDSIAWAFNIRGGDISHNPVALAFAIVPVDGKPELFIDARKVGGNVKTTLDEIAKLQDPAAFGRRLSALGKRGATVRVDPGATNLWIGNRLKAAGAKIVHGADPCLLPKARKNVTEIEGARQAHERDGVAVCRFLAWLDREAGGSDAKPGRIDEIAAARKLEAFRMETKALKEISFDTISGAGPNGAIVHYRPLVATNRTLNAGELYLVDSGAQYLDGTTDITRTIAIGKPSAEMRERFTLVLKGHIAVAMARFPQGTRGVEIDSFARRALWAAGLDYDHGTGHGVGSYLSVHEGPQSISKGGVAQALEPGMIVSNEPGYYKEGAYGIRIENLLLVTQPQAIAGGERPMLGFETLTLAPIDRTLIDGALLDNAEITWLDAYHTRVLAVIGPKLKGEDARFLQRATAKLAHIQA